MDIKMGKQTGKGGNGHMTSDITSSFGSATNSAPKPDAGGRPKHTRGDTSVPGFLDGTAKQPYNRTEPGFRTPDDEKFSKDRV